MAHANEALIRREFEALVSGDMRALVDCYSDDYVLHYPGRNRAAGDYQGRDGLAQFIDRLKGLGINVTRDLHDALANEEHGIQLVTVRADRGSSRHQWNGVVVMHFRDGKIAEAWVHIDDQYALDEFLS